jgi:two-component system osmolarity sensor histidine kinase EnvZ
VLRILKKLFPQTFMGRLMMIFVMPVLFMQVLVLWVYINRQMMKIPEVLASYLANATHMIISQVPSHGPIPLKSLEKKISAIGLNLTYKPSDQNIPLKHIDNDWRVESLYQGLDQVLTHPFYVTVDDDFLHIWVKTDRGIFIFQGATRKLVPRSLPLIIWWMVLSPLFFMVIGGLFLRNQVKPIEQLSQAMVDFGKGQETKSFRPRGALEIRQAAVAFSQMKERLRRQLEQRTLMLAGVSHDLRAPLTRMQLEVTMLEDINAKKALFQDIHDMMRLVEEYLEFASGYSGETLESFDMIPLMEDVLSGYPHRSHNISWGSYPETCIYKGRSGAIKRAFQNVIDNSLRYGLFVTISCQVGRSFVQWIIDDDGPGISPKDYERVLMPFVRLESSRNLETGGYGLGLSITADILHGHGGMVRFETPPKGVGLRVILSFPR